MYQSLTPNAFATTDQKITKTMARRLAENPPPNVMQYTDLHGFLTDVMRHFAKCGISQRKLVILVGRKSPNYFKRILSGRHKINEATCMALGEICGYNKVQLAYLRRLRSLTYHPPMECHAIQELLAIKDQWQSPKRVKIQLEEHYHMSLIYHCLVALGGLNEADLCETLQRRMNRATLKNALQQMKSIGIIDSKIGKYTAIPFASISARTNPRALREAQTCYLHHALHNIAGGRSFYLHDGMTTVLSKRQIELVVSLYQTFLEGVETVILTRDERPQKIVRLQFLLFDALA